MSVVSQIKHYQQSIEKCSHDEKRILHCIEKLYKLPVTVQHLQETGVGRTVNALRKYEGTVGDAAKALVAKWKSMVVDEDSSEDDNDHNQQDVNDGSSDNSSISPEKESSNHRESHQSSHKSSRHDSKSKSDHSSSKENSRADNDKKSTKSSHNSTDSKKEKERDRKDKNKEKHSRDHDKTKREESNHKSSSAKSSEASSRKESSSSSSKVSKVHKETNGDVERKRKYESHEESEKTSHKRRKDSTSEASEDNNDDRILPATTSSSSSASPSPKIESKELKPDRSEKIKSDKHKSSSEKSDKKSDRKSEKLKDSSKSRHHSSSRVKSEKSDRSESSRQKKSEHSTREKSKHSKNDAPDKKTSKKKLNSDDGIDCNSGASFAEALGMCSHPVSKKKAVSNASSSSPVMKPPKSEPSTSRQITKTETSRKDDGLSLLAPNVKLEPLNVDFATLPEISPNYKPLPLDNHINSINRKLDEERALNDVMYAKNMRTKVYSGAKTGYTSVPSLYDLCIRILIEHIDALEATGGVPYDILKPVLEKATPDQLFTLEHHNPYLMEDTDVLWKFHVNREFRSEQRQEMEGWREMYMRCLDAREAKLKALTANIKQSIDKSLPVRSTKLAYVDNVVKPPRGVIRKQAKYGTANSTSSSTSDVKRKLLSGANSVTNISVPAPPASSRVRPSTGIVKKNKAPLMAKALQLIKGRYRR